MMREAWAKKKPSLITDSWQTGLVPEGECVIVRPPLPDLQAWLALGNHGCACLSFPIKRHEGDFLVLHFTSEAARHLEYKYVQNFKDVFILPTTPVSPLHCLVMQRSKPHLQVGLQLKIVGKPIQLIDFQAERGFANVKEAVMRKLYLELEVPEMTSSDDSVSSEDVLAAGLVLARKPKITQPEFAGIMHTRKMLESGHEKDECEELSQEVLDDVLNASDRSHIQAGRKAMQEEKAKRNQRRKAVARLLLEMESKLPKGKATKQKAATKAEKQRKEKGERWWASIPGDMEAVLQYKPENAIVTSDDANGRFLCRHLLIKGSRQSVSWTRRGMDAAVAIVLRLCWEWEVEVSGIDCPLPAEWIGELFA